MLKGSIKKVIPNLSTFLSSLHLRWTAQFPCYTKQTIRISEPISTVLKKKKRKRKSSRDCLEWGSFRVRKTDKFFRHLVKLLSSKRKFNLMRLLNYTELVLCETPWSRTAIQMFIVWERAIQCYRRLPSWKCSGYYTSSMS